MPKSDYWPFVKNKNEELQNEFEVSVTLEHQLGDMESEVKEIEMEISEIKKDRMELFNRACSKDIFTESLEAPKDENDIKRPKLENSNISKIYEDNLNVTTNDEEMKSFKREYAKINKMGEESLEAPKDDKDLKRPKRKNFSKIYEDDLDVGGNDEEMKSFKREHSKIHKICELSKLREDFIRAKNIAAAEISKREKMEETLKDLEKKFNTLCENSTVMKTRATTHIESLNEDMEMLKDELDVYKMSLVIKGEQMREYQFKYLQSEQQVEELKKQIQTMECNNKEVSEQVNIEIQKMKMHFQVKIQELAPLPTLLKSSQIRLQEAKDMQKLAEDNSQELSNELQRVKEKLINAVNSINHDKAEYNSTMEENKMMKATLEEKQKEIDKLNKCNEDCKAKIFRLEERLVQQENRFTEKTSEYDKLHADLDNLRVESVKSLYKCKERAEAGRRNLNMQIAELERRLIQSRAQCSGLQKEREDIRQRLQMEVNVLKENLELQEMRVRDLQTQVISLKSNTASILTHINGDIEEPTRHIQN